MSDRAAPPNSQPIVLDEAALSDAEKAYWTDDGVARHNLAVAIRTYLRAVEAGSPPSDEHETPALPDQEQST